MIKNKKGSLADVVYGPAKFLAIVITFFICFYIWHSFTTTFDETLYPTLSDAGKLAMNETVSNISIGMTTIDYMMPLIIFGLLIVSLIFAFKTGANVIYAILSLILWVLALIMSAIFTNTYLQVDDALNLGTTLVISDFLMTNLKWIVLGWLVLISIVMFSRNKQEQEMMSSSEKVFGG